MTTLPSKSIVLSNNKDQVFKSVENGFFNCKLTVKDGGDLTISLRPDGFVNATQLCKAGKKLFADWKRMDSTQELIQVLKSSMGIHIDLLIDTKMTGKNEERGSWIHPDLAVQLAQWISPSFAIQVSRWVREIALTGKVEQGKEKTNEELLKLQQDLLLKDEVIKSIVSEKDIIKKNYSHLERIHDNLKRTRNYHKFKKGKCCYILHDPWRTDSYYKVGETLDIDQRLQQYRTSMPECKVAFLVYLDDNKLLEKCIKVRYAKELDPCPNHEWVSGGIKLEQIIKSFKMLIRFLKLSVSYENTLDIYNNPYDPDYKIWPDENMAILNFIEDDTKEDDLESESEEEEENIKEYKCEKCDKVYKLQGNLLNHIKNKHPVEIKDEIKQEHKDDDKTNTCNICNKTLANKGKLNRHVKHVHEKSGRVKCKSCKEIFNSKDSLNGHIRNVHEKKTASKCEECDFVATTPGNLKRHIENIHKHNSQFECDICKSMYKTKTYLNLHIQTVHKKVCQTKCDLCGIVLCSNKSLKYHRFSIHKI